MLKRIFIILSLQILITAVYLFPQQFSINKIEPPNWWTGMKWHNVQLMVYGENLKGADAFFSDERLKVTAVHSVESPDYLFIDVEIPEDLPGGEYTLTIGKGENDVKFEYPIFHREFLPAEHKGFSNEDVIYLIIADRYCDGNPDNNTIGDSLEQFTSVDLDGRKGGDIEGIISKLDYLSTLGVTTLWITPMLENNMWMSYHGYAATDLYKIDPRFGSNKLYKRLVYEAHKKGIKIILDHVSNHIGINHRWIKNLPTEDWINGSVENHLPAHHDKMAFLDMHGDSIVVIQTTEGWFANYMPDLNQLNPFLKKYLIQNTLWWIEYSGLDGVREDTYPYADQKYLSEWAMAIMDEYPDFNIVGEIWKGVPSILSGYQHDSKVRSKFDSNLPAITDFAMADAVRSFLSKDDSIYKIYETLAQDIVYTEPDNLLVFMDNHDVERAMYVAKGDVDRFKIALNLILFTRGIPVLFYGTEIGIKGDQSHGTIRSPFPGGFSGDERSAFTQEGRSAGENDIYDYLHKLLTLRKQYPALSKGKLTHVYPGGGTYILLRETEDERIIILFNTAEKEMPVKTEHLKLLLGDINRLTNLKTNVEYELDEGIVFSIGRMNADIFKVIE